MPTREQQPRSRYSLPGMLKPLSERRSVPEQPSTTLPSWNATWGMIELMTYSNRKERRYVRRKRNVVKEAYDARYFAATGGGTERVEEFNKKYTIDKESGAYNPGMIDRLAPYLVAMRDSFPKSPTRR